MFSEALTTAVGLLIARDPQLCAIITLSLRVSLAAVTLAAVIGLPLGAILAVGRFPLRRLIVVVINTCLGLPPVVAGLFVYLLLSRAGPLGSWGLLFTPSAMVIAQCVLVTPIIAALTYQTITDLHRNYDEPLRALGVSRRRAMTTLLWDGRYSLLTALLAGFGRAHAEVGAVIIVGGNINHVTRVMTTTIALETSKGNLALALALSIILLGLALCVNAALQVTQRVAQRMQGL